MVQPAIPREDDCNSLKMLDDTLNNARKLFFSISASYGLTGNYCRLEALLDGVTPFC